jgi:DNA-binding response OmpR family regulator
MEEESWATVVIATDDAALGAMLTAESEAVGATVYWETDGFAAYEAILQHEPDVAMLDVNLPVHTGVELAGMLRADPSVAGTLIVALLTDDAMEPHTMERAGVTCLFPKTHDAAELREWLVNSVAEQR